jgi:hypothetical protein
MLQRADESGQPLAPLVQRERQAGTMAREKQVEGHKRGRHGSGQAPDLQR